VARKIGRNEPCPCGSGKKYKKCCEDRGPSVISVASQRKLRRLTPAEEKHPDIVAAKRASDAKQARVLGELRERFGVHVNFVAPVDFQGGKVWVLGSRLYTDRPLDETFHEFLISVLKGSLGEGWRTEQASSKTPHFLMKCFDEYGNWTRQVSEEHPSGPGVRAAAPNGWVQYLLSVAWDFATLIHASNGQMPGNLVERLKEPVAFQGARYELAVAALFARLDCEIEFLDEVEELRGRSRPEFIARHRPTGQAMAVEAKSRHRPGILNHEGDRDEQEPLRKDARMVRSLFIKALKKEVGDLPLLIFIDINAPIESDVQGLEKAWAKDIQAWMGRIEKGSADEPEKYAGLYVTNFSPHYVESDLAPSGEWLCVIPLFSAFPVDMAIHDQIHYALDRFDRIPDFGFDGTVR
jgi:hypothetical protein